MFTRVLAWALRLAQAKRRGLLLLALATGLLSPVLQGLSVAILSWLPGLFNRSDDWSPPTALAWLSDQLGTELLGSGEQAALAAIAALFAALLSAALAQYLSKALLLRLSRDVVEDLLASMLVANRSLPNPAWPVASRLMVFEQPVVFQGVYFTGVFLNQVLSTFPALATALIAAAFLLYTDATFAMICFSAGLLLPLATAPFVSQAPRKLEDFKAANQALHQALKSRFRSDRAKARHDDDARLVSDYGRTFQGRLALSQQLVAVLGVGTAMSLSLGVCYFFLQFSWGQASIADAIISIGALKLALNSVSRVAATVGSVSRHHRSIQRAWRFFTCWHDGADPADGQPVDADSRLRIGSAGQYEFATSAPLALVGTRSISEACLALMSACDVATGATVAVSSGELDQQNGRAASRHDNPLWVLQAARSPSEELASILAVPSASRPVFGADGQVPCYSPCALVHRRLDSVGSYNEGAIAWISNGEVTDFATRGSQGWDAIVARARDAFDHNRAQASEGLLDEVMAAG